MKRAYVVGIGGDSASGKSTLTSRLEERLSDYKVKVFRMDKYFREASERPDVAGILNGKIYRDDNHPNTLDLERLHADVLAAREEDWDIILIEGMFILWDEAMAPVLDLKVFVDCDPDERLRRRVTRNLAFGQDLEEIMERYVQAVVPRQREYVEPSKWKADIIVNGFRTVDDGPAGVDIILSWIEKNAAGA
ncbi:uridine kinase family protein [Acetatifactor aquisgranensis]|uniref:uridine kinase family protein n=1 Tax=Acetatifactor aquisgranensis TaxID=2941233 RepID=UPI0020426772|nr:AAA family ATPase [Acetatifactor aquisgranensis]MCI8542348.1 AAA family ATPase [Lachnospiraceae bacterium]